mmetsp:Transcript_68177/g.83621  ORF Transcript_68177/g.83621 Transcript_68177/m.83621 type:complete len:367 (+) Transcript_68177:121-1221(+)
MGTKMSQTNIIEQSTQLMNVKSNNNNNNNNNVSTKNSESFVNIKNNNTSSLFSVDLNDLNESKWWRAMIAGSFAGLSEHSLLYPIDTIKTRIQSQVNLGINPEYNSFSQTFLKIVRKEKPRALFRGLSAVLCTAIPSHGAYFMTYELSKQRLNYKNGEHNPIKIGLCGIVACMAHDLIVTPFDVIKQRMQLFYKECPKSTNLCSCAMNVLKREGYISFFRSYPATVLLNIPVFCTNFIVYESTKIILSKYINKSNNKYINNISNDKHILHFMVSGGIAGGCAGLISNPLDIIKTSIQTDKQIKGYISMKHTVNKILNNHPKYGYNIFFLGSTSRIIYMIPSAAITWTTYECVKILLGFPVHDLDMD